tara:strand:+ start:32 stop:658 length:627 start_codon:yes stop_codon:yes gene_type:complete
MQEREAGLKRTQELRSMSASETIKYLSKSEPARNIEAKAQGYRPLNLNQFLQQKGVSSDPNVPVLAFQAQSLQDVQKPQPIDVDKVESWAQLRSSQKQTEARRTLADFGTIPSNIPTVQQESPTSRRMGFGQGGGAANLGLGYNTITEPQSFTDYAFGRINTPIQEIIVEKPEIIEETKTIQPDYTKIALIGVGVFAVLALIIVRMKK